MTSLIQHKFYRHPDQLKEPSTGALEYWIAKNGVFVRGQRPELEALLPISQHENAVRGLEVLQPFVALKKLNWTWLDIVAGMARDNLPNEILFHWIQTPSRDWHLVIPDQNWSYSHCKPVETGYDSSAHRAIVEIHSHGESSAYFSHTDNKEENSGFRIYGVLGKLHQARPELLLRVGLFGHFWIIPASAVFEGFRSRCGLIDIAPPTLPYYQAKEPDHADSIPKL